MTTLPRVTLNLAGALLALGWVEAARGATTPDTPPDVTALLASLPKWSTSLALNGGYGYKDNLLLSYSGEERSTFARYGVEFVALRVPQGSFDFSFYGEAERTHYFTAKTSDNDAKVWVRTEPAYRLGSSWRLGLPLTGFYYDQVFDVSDTDVERRVAELKVHGGMVGPVARWDFHRHAWAEVQAVGQRKRYDDGVNDGKVGEGGLTLGWSGISWLEARLTGQQRWTNYDTRQQYTSSGRELDGTHLKIAEREIQVRADIALDRAGRWQTTTRVSLLHFRDNGTGYFNYREYKLDQELEWRQEAWRVRVGGTASRRDYSVQKVGLGIDPPPRIKDEFSTSVQAERTLSRQWTVVGKYAWERSRSNDLFASYQVNEGWLGLRWSWEK